MSKVFFMYHCIIGYLFQNIYNISKIYGRIRKTVVKYVSESSQGITQWRLDRLDPVRGDEYGYF